MTAREFLRTMEKREARRAAPEVRENGARWAKKPAPAMREGSRCDSRPIEFPPYEQVKDRVQQEMMKGLRDKKIEELRAAAKVE